MITSTSNQLVKLVSSLHHKKGRQEHNLYLAEGIHPVSEAVKAGVTIRQYCWSQKLSTTQEGAALQKRLEKTYPGVEVSDLVMAKLCETETPQGIVAIVELPPETPPDLSGVTLGLVIDGLQDPGNVGTMIRTAWAAGVDCLLVTPQTADVYQGKVVRSSMGGIFHQRIYRNVPPDVIAAAAVQSGLRVVAGYPEAPQICYATDLTCPTLLLVGNEAQGISSAWEKYPMEKVAIPQPGRAESLNVSVAAGILLYEAVRQRLASMDAPVGNDF